MDKEKLNLKPKQEDEVASFIIESFNLRKSKNARYSIRAFANFLEVDHSLLSKFLKGEIELSDKLKLKCLQRLGGEPEQIKKCLKRIHKNHYFEEISDDEFEVISNWIHFAILELISLPGFNTSHRSIARSLGVEIAEVKSCLARLEALQYIKKTEGTFELLKVSNTFYPSKNTTRAKIENQSELLKKSDHSLKNDPLAIRDHSSVFVAVNRSEMPLFKDWIQDARRQLVKLFQRNKDFDEVYCLQVSFFPLTNNSGELE